VSNVKYTTNRRDSRLKLKKLRMQVSRQSVDEQVYEILKTQIITLQFRLGQEIVISRVAKELGVSNTPVRHAVSRLLQEGWLQKDSNGRHRIIELCGEDICEIYDTRKLLETHALDKAIKKVNPSKWQTLLTRSRELESKKRDVKGPESYLFWELDGQIHSLIMSNYNTTTLRRLFNQIYEIVLISQRMGTQIETSLQEHILLLEEILKKNVENAKQILATHIDNAKQDAIRNLNTYYDRNKDK